MHIAQNQPPFLTQAEITDICSPLIAGAAQCKYLERMGMLVKRKRNGSPLVARTEFERVMTGGQIQPDKLATMTAPNTAGLQSFFQKRKNGTRT